VVAIAGAMFVAPQASAATPCVDNTHLKFCAALDRTAYKSGDIVTVTVTITNEDSTPADGLWLSSAGGSFFSYTAWQGDQAINSPRQGTEIAPGAT
jgi:hypothetical protein